MVAATQLTPEDYGNYAQQRRKVTNTYQLGLSDNTFQRSQADNAWTKAQGDLAQKYDGPNGLAAHLADGYGSRGLLNSGIFQSALTGYGTQKGADYGGASDAYQNTLATLLQNRGNLDKTWTADGNQVSADETAKTAADKANMIRAAVGSGGVSY